jgi:hypothetical protein
MGRDEGDRAAVATVVANRGTGTTEFSTRSDQSGLMLAERITLPHFSVSSAISLP